MRVLVTGATGFLGGHVCRELGERGHEVSALCRRPGSAPAGTSEVPGNLAESGTGLAEAIAADRPECVVHLAAEIGSQRDPRRIEEVNVRGTERLLAACAATGSPKVVFTSTVVTGDAQGKLLTEETPLPVQTAYGRSKQTGERMVLEAQRPGVVIRPSHVYGSGGWYVEEFVSRLRKPGRFAVIGRGNNWWDVVRVEDVATAVADAAERAPDGAVYHVVDDEPITFYDFMALTADALGTGRPRRIPARIAALAGGREPVMAVTRSARSSNARIKRELGWEPRFPTAATGVPDAISAL
jgi:nucleoside-diphosphate-sugar epimerase